MRTIKLMDEVTQEITVINNSRISDIVKQTNNETRFFVDIKPGHDVGFIKGEKILQEILAKLPERCPEIIGKPQYLGVVELPEHNPAAGMTDDITFRVAVTWYPEQDFMNLLQDAIEEYDRMIEDYDLANAA